MTHVEFWFDFASTYSYLAAMRLPAAADRAGVAVVWRPFLLGPIFQAQGWNDSPFNIYPAKGRYMWRDMARLTAQYGLPLQRPSVFPRNGLTAARLALVGLEDGWGPAFIQAVFRANFGADQEIADKAVLSRLLADMGVDADAAYVRAQSDEIKKRLKDQTARAMALGVFGAPTFVADGEIFWGDDRLEYALAWARQANGSASGSPRSLTLTRDDGSI